MASYVRFWNERLNDLDNPPPEPLYARSAAARRALTRPTVAIIGARSCSTYGAQIARKLARELGEAGLTVVSGLARGIDAEAHRGALDVDGRTVAVLGCGIDRDYPRANVELAVRMEERGGVISEYPPETPPAPWRFPARNRIVAALSDAIVVVEARELSGAIITAGFGLELGRPLYAVPGEITSCLSRGTNALIRDGHAVLLSSAGELVDSPAALLRGAAGEPDSHRTPALTSIDSHARNERRTG